MIPVLHVRRPRYRQLEKVVMSEFKLSFGSGLELSWAS